MNTPVRVTFRNLEHSDAIDAYVHERAAKLETFCPRITGCHVTVEAPHLHQRNGRHFRICVDLMVPGGEVAVSRAPDANLVNEDVYAAVDQAFDQAGRRLEDHVRRQRGDVKAHESAYTKGRVSKLWTYEGYGFLEPADGGEVYFHRNSVLDGGFDRLKIGSTVRFIEELGEKGPQASTVIILAP